MLEYSEWCRRCV